MGMDGRDGLATSIARVVAGSAAGFAGALVGGPQGVVLTAAVQPLIEQTLTDVVRRLQTDAQIRRTATVLDIAAERATAYRAKGEQLRNDDFFHVRPDGRSSGAEVIEGVLIAAQDTYEELKLRHLGELMARVAFRPQYSSSMAHWALHVAKELTYDHYLALALVGKAPKSELPRVALGVITESSDEWAFLRSFDEIGPYDRRLIHHGQETTWGDSVGFSIPISQYGLTEGGQVLFDLLSLDSIDSHALAKIKACLMAIQKRVHSEGS